MNLYTYRYQILRYVADLDRMEPVNIGVVVQNNHRTTFRINDDLSRVRAADQEFDPEAFARWVEFFREECEGPPAPGQPDRGTEEFLEHLGAQCRRRYQLTAPRPMAVDVPHLEAVCDWLFGRLVSADNARKEPVASVQSYHDRRPRPARRDRPVAVREAVAHRQWSDNSLAARPPGLLSRAAGEVRVWRVQTGLARGLGVAGALFVGAAFGRAWTFKLLPTWAWLFEGALLLLVGMIAMRAADERNREYRVRAARGEAAQSLMSGWKVLRNGLIPAFIADPFTDLRFELFEARLEEDEVALDCTGLFYDTDPARIAPSAIGLKIRKRLFADLAGATAVGIAVDMSDAASILGAGLSHDFLAASIHNGVLSIAIVPVRTVTEALGVMVVSSSRHMSEVKFDTPELIGRILAMVAEVVAPEFDRYLRATRGSAGLDKPALIGNRGLSRAALAPDATLGLTLVRCTQANVFSEHQPGNLLDEHIAGPSRDGEGT